ncbi:MAG: PKD domain-containing protein [Dissulfurispiraceae bacterium]
MKIEGAMELLQRGDSRMPGESDSGPAFILVLRGKCAGRNKARGQSPIKVLTKAGPKEGTVMERYRLPLPSLIFLTARLTGMVATLCVVMASSVVMLFAAGYSLAASCAATSTSSVPLAKFTWLQANQSGLVNFNASSAFCPAGSTCSYSWSFGDGETDNSNSIQLSHTYPLTAGSTNYRAMLTVTNTTANTSASIRKVITVNVSSVVAGTVSLSNRTVILIDASSAGSSITVNWGDGTARTTGNSGATFTHTYAVRNTYTIVQTATVQGIIASRNLSVTVPAKYTVSGTVTNVLGTPLSGVLLTLTLAGVTKGITCTNATGTYRFINVVPGTYTIAADSKAHIFANPAVTVTVTTDSLTGQNFSSSN